MGIIISHTHEQGTLILGSTKGDGVWPIASKFRFRPSRQVGLFLRGSRDRVANRQRINDCAEALRAAGFEVEVSIDDTPRDRAAVLADQADRLNDRRDAIAGKAARGFATAQAHHDRADRISHSRPAGQPILADHHSARRAWRDQETIDRSLHSYHDEFDRATKIQRRADAVGRDLEYAQSPAATALRIPRLEKELRGIDRDLSEYTTPLGAQPAAIGGRRETLLTRRQQLVDQLDYDRRLLEQAVKEGQWVQHSSQTIRPGDLVSVYAQGNDWRRVVKANRVTVAVESGYSWTDKLPYEKIRRHHRVEGNPQAEP